jgi:hypothetical protein
LPTASQTTSAALRQRLHALSQILRRRIDGHGGAEALGHGPALGDRIGEDETLGAAAAGQHHRQQSHDAAADHQHGGAARHVELLESGETARGRLRHGRGDGIEAARQRMDIGYR